MKGQMLRIIIFIFAFVLLGAFFLKSSPVKQLTIIPTLTPSPTPFIFTTYTPPVIARKEVYKIAMLGDSMTAALGPHGGGLSEYMNSLYKKSSEDPQRIIIDNYAKSSNILAVNNEITQKTTISEYTFGPLLLTDYDLILVESYGYNPLSQFGGIEEGIKQQDNALDKLMATLIIHRPNAVVVFVATISPNKENYAKVENPNSTVTARENLADERIAYIKNHIAYAKNHNIPLINIYQDSLTPSGDGNMLYINLTDDIHPSFAGIDFIGHEIGNFIFNNKILPQ